MSQHILSIGVVSLYKNVYQGAAVQELGLAQAGLYGPEMLLNLIACQVGREVNP